MAYFLMDSGWNTRMARGRLLAALAVTLLLTGTARATESEERALRDQFADRDEYRTKLILELQRREALLVQQQEVLKRQEDRLQELYAKLSQPVSDEEEDAGATGAPAPALKSVSGKKLAPDTTKAKRAKDFETQTYKTNLARYNVAQTRKDIAYLQGLLSRTP
jgi:hypothetical protein